MGVWEGGRWLEDRGWMIEHRKAYRDTFNLRSSIFDLQSSIFVFFSHTPIQGSSLATSARLSSGLKLISLHHRKSLQFSATGLTFSIS